MFKIYFELGWRHILDINGYDHMLFLLILGCVYLLKDWRQIALLVTAFTLGHAITLGLATFEVISLPGKWIEWLIALTIGIGAVYQFMKPINQRAPLLYPLTLVFGLIHGLGFSNFLRSSILPGQENELWKQLLAFNLGVEAGQLFFVLVMVLITTLFVQILRCPLALYKRVLSGIGFLIAMWMMIDRLPF